MPAKTEKQPKFMGAELARKRAGNKTSDRHEREGVGENGQQEEELAAMMKLALLLLVPLAGGLALRFVRHRYARGADHGLGRADEPGCAADGRR